MSEAVPIDPQNIVIRSLLAVHPQHSVSFCPICGGGLCGIRVCDGPNSPAVNWGDEEHACDAPESGSLEDRIDESSQRHGMVVCDECEAIWLLPDTESEHLYPDPEDACCPICGESLWGPSGHWASSEEVIQLGWTAAVDHQLDFETDEGIA